MFNASNLINEVLGAGSGANMQKGKDYLSKNAGGLAGGVVAGGLAGYMLGSKKGRKMAKKTVQYGGMALVAGLAYKAYRDWQGGKQPQPQQPQQQPSVTYATPNSVHTPQTQQIEPQSVTQPTSNIPSVPRGSAFEIDAESDSTDCFGAAIVSAMIAAAKADGQIDGEEHEAIFAKIDDLALSNDEKAFLMDQLRRPLDIDNLVNLAQNKEQAVELYVASLMAINVDNAAEQGYLGMLSARLNLEPALLDHIHGSMSEATIA